MFLCGLLICMYGPQRATPAAATAAAAGERRSHQENSQGPQRRQADIGGGKGAQATGNAR